MSDIAQKLRDLADEIDGTKPEPAQPWPPKGVSIEVDANGNGKYLPRTSTGDGFYFHPHGGLQSLKDTPWRYTPAPWDIAPDRAKSWFVTSDAETGWSVHEEEVGGQWRFGTIIYVEYREDK